MEAGEMRGSVFEQLENRVLSSAVVDMAGNWSGWIRFKSGQFSVQFSEQTQAGRTFGGYLSLGTSGPDPLVTYFEGDLRKNGAIRVVSLGSDFPGQALSSSLHLKKHGTFITGKMKLLFSSGLFAGKQKVSFQLSR